MIRASVVKATGRLCVQEYASRMVVDERGKIKLMRESVDIIASARVMLPNGLADIPSVEEVSS
jgi:uncharacterized protein